MPQDGALFVGVEEGQPGRALDPALDPRFLFGVLDVHELDADRAAIGLAEDLHDLPQGRGFAAEHVVDENRLVHVGFGEAVGFRIELGVRGRFGQAQRVELGFEVTAHAIGADQHQRPQGRDDGGADLIQGKTALRRFRCHGFGLVEAGPGCPGGAAGIFQHSPRFVVHCVEQVGEALIDGGGIVDPPRVEVGQECRVGATEG